MKSERGPLVRREAAREPDREQVRLETGSLDNAAPGLLVDVPERFGLQVGRRLPVRLVRRRLRADSRLSQQLGERGVEPCPRWTPFVTWPIGGAPPSRSGQSSAHISRATSPWSVGDAIREAGQAEREGRQPEAGLLAGAAELEQRRAVDARPRRRAGRRSAATSSWPKISFPAGTGVCVVKTVGRRTCSSASPRRRPCSTSARSRSIARNAEWPSFMWKTLASTRARPAPARRRRRAGAPAGCGARGRRRRGASVSHVHLERVERESRTGRPSARPPREIVSPREVDLDGDGLAHEPCRLRIDGLVLLGLPPGRVETLREVAAAVEQADADERDAELGGGLEVVAGEDAEAAGVDRQRLLDAELHAEVGDEQPCGVIAVSPLPPGR